MKVSIIIPVYNEEGSIGSCLDSLSKQTIKCEVIVVDDGSTDGTLDKIQDPRYKIQVHRQDHQGPGAARNLGASKATGEILVFVDVDMEFEPYFISKLVDPIITGKAIGSYSKEEFLLNRENIWARCWNINFGRSADSMGPRDFDQNKNRLYKFGKNILQKFEGKSVVFEKDKSHVFRAILKREFDRVGGFDPSVGYTDDWSLSDKLGIMATPAPGAKFYHSNPATLKEVWRQARWFGKNVFLTKNIIRRVYNLFRYSPVSSIIIGLIVAIKTQETTFVPFKIIFDSAVFTSVLLSFISEPKTR